jgi:hypothetical protein
VNTNTPVDTSALPVPPFPTTLSPDYGKIHPPPYLQLSTPGFTSSLIYNLPLISASASTTQIFHNEQDPEARVQKANMALALGLEREKKKVKTWMKVVDLRNASKGGVDYENRRRIVKVFSVPHDVVDIQKEEWWDPGKQEVQGVFFSSAILFFMVLI